MQRPCGIIALAIILALALTPVALAEEVQEIQIDDAPAKPTPGPQETCIGEPLPHHGAGEAPWGPEGTAERQRRRQAKLNYTQAIDEFNAGNYEKAVQLIKSYLAVFPADSQAQALLERSRRLARAQRVGWLRVSCDPQAQVLVDGKPVGRTPLKLELAVGPHEVEVRAQGLSQSGHVFIKPRTTHGISFDLHPRWQEEGQGGAKPQGRRPGR